MLDGIVVAGVWSTWADRWAKRLLGAGAVVAGMLVVGWYALIPVVAASAFAAVLLAVVIAARRHDAAQLALLRARQDDAFRQLEMRTESLRLVKPDIQHREYEIRCTTTGCGYRATRPYHGMAKRDGESHGMAHNHTVVVEGLRVWEEVIYAAPKAIV